MEGHGAVQAHLALSRQYLATGRRALEAGDLAPARFNALHALELAIKACILHAGGEARRTHNVGGEFARLYRDRIGVDVTHRLNRMLGAYDQTRYPDKPPPAESVVEGEVAYIEWFVHEAAPGLLAAAPEG